MADEQRNAPGGSGWPHVDAALCTDILAGLASREDVSRVLAHLKICLLCEEQFRLMAADYEALRAGPVPRRSASGEIVLAASDAGLAESGASPGQAESSGETRSPLGLLRRMRSFLPRLAPALAVGTAAVILLLVMSPWRGHAPPARLAYWIPAGGDLLAQRAGGGSGDLGALLEGIRAYEKRDLGKAIRTLEGAHLAGGAEDLRRLYLASAFQLKGDASRALQTVSGIDPDALPEARRDEVLWVRYVALVETGRAREARVLLDRLATATGPIGELARRQSVSSKDASPDPP